jgi:DNA-binding LacI/PurR family transcriptional regulator
MSAKVKKVTMADLAKKAKVSKATVSRALAGSSLIGDEVRERIEEIAREAGYVRRTVRRQGERGILTIKLVLPPRQSRTASLFYRLSDLVDGLRAGVSPSGVNVMVESGGAGFDPFPHKKGGEVDAFVFAFHRPEAGVLRTIEEQGAAVMVLNREVRGVRHVVSDHRDAMRQMAAHLAEKGVQEGCCFVGYAGIEAVWKARLAGFVEGCREHGIAFDEEKDVWLADRPEDLTVAEMACRHRCGARCFVGVNDVTGVIILQHGRALGFRVPCDIRVTGCDNAAVRGVAFPALTTVELSMLTLAEKMGRSLFAEIVEGEPGPDRVTVKGSLLRGGTT